MKKGAIITGVSSGIGKALCTHLLDLGFEVLGISRRKVDFDHENFTHIAADLSDLDALSQMKIDGLKADHIYLINNAGTLGNSSHLNQKTAQEIDHALRLNVTAPMFLSKRVMQSYGHKVQQIINISSGAAEAVIDGWTTYCASKAALNQYSRVYQLELQQEGYDTQVMAIGPGVVDTEMQSEIRTSSETGFSQVQNFIDMKADGVLKTPQEIASLLTQFIQGNLKAPDLYFSLRDFY